MTAGTFSSFYLPHVSCISLLLMLTTLFANITARAKANLAIPPFTSTQGDEGEAVAEMFSFEIDDLRQISGDIQVYETSREIRSNRNVKIALVAAMMGVFSINCLRAQSVEEGVVHHIEKIVESEDSAGGTNSQRMTLIEFAMKHQGIPYRSGGSTVKGFDCSGFVWFVYRKALNMDVPRSSRGIWSSDAKTVRLEDALPGDVLVFSANKGGSGSISHTAILVDKDFIIHAVSSGPKRGVVISPITDRYFAPRLAGVKRFLPDD